MNKLSTTKRLSVLKTQLMQAIVQPESVQSGHRKRNLHANIAARNTLRRIAWKGILICTVISDYVFLRFKKKKKL